jgi:hypothetical protein
VATLSMMASILSVPGALFLVLLIASIYSSMVMSQVSKCMSGAGMGVQ